MAAPYEGEQYLVRNPNAPEFQTDLRRWNEAQVPNLPINFAISADFHTAKRPLRLVGVLQMSYRMFGEGQVVFPVRLKTRPQLFAGLTRMVEYNRSKVREYFPVERVIDEVGLKAGRVGQIHISDSALYLYGSTSLVMGRSPPNDPWRGWAADNSSNAASGYVLSAFGFVRSVQSDLPDVRILPLPSRELLSPHI